MAYRLTKDYAATMVNCREALDLWQTISSESEYVAVGFNSLGEVERLLKDYDAAERHHKEALRIAKKIGDIEGIALYSGSLALLALDREQWEEAEQLAREALPLRESLGRMELVGNVCQWLAKACARQGRKVEGLPYAQRAVAIFTKLRSPYLTEAQEVLTECEE